MDDLEMHIEEYKSKNPEQAIDFEIGYEDFKIGAILKTLRKSQGITQEEIAAKIGTYKNNISRLENHSEDVKLSTIEKYIFALGKKIKISIV